MPQDTRRQVNSQTFLLRSSASFSRFDSLETNKQLSESFLKLPVNLGNSKPFENGAVLKRSETRLWHRLGRHFEP